MFTSILAGLLASLSACNSSSPESRTFDATLEATLCHSTKQLARIFFSNHLWRREHELEPSHQDTLLQILEDRHQWFSKIAPVYAATHPKNVSSAQKRLSELHLESTQQTFVSTFESCTLLKEIDQFVSETVSDLEPLDSGVDDLSKPYNRYDPYPTIYHEYIDTLLRSMDSFSHLDLSDSRIGTENFSYGFRYRVVREPSSKNSFAFLVTLSLPESPLIRGDKIVGMSFPFKDLRSPPPVISLDEWGQNPKDFRKLTKAIKAVYQPYILARVLRGTEFKDVLLESASQKMSLVFAQIKASHTYIALTGFDHGAALGVSKVLESIDDKQPIILDLQGNPGGSVFEMVLIARLFVGQSPLGKFRSRQSLDLITAEVVDESHFSTPGISHPISAPKDTRLVTRTQNPLIVLIDDQSASASEILAYSLQSLERAILIGSKTYGKGIGQRQVVDGWAQSAPMLTTFQYYGIDGVSPQRDGVKPDILLSNLSHNQRATDLPEALMIAAGPRVAPIVLETRRFAPFRRQTLAHPAWADFHGRFSIGSLDQTLIAAEEWIHLINSSPLPESTALR